MAEDVPQCEVFKLLWRDTTVLIVIIFYTLLVASFLQKNDFHRVPKSKRKEFSFHLQGMKFSSRAVENFVSCERKHDQRPFKFDQHVVMYLNIYTIIIFDSNLQTVADSLFISLFSI